MKTGVSDNDLRGKSTFSQKWGDDPFTKIGHTQVPNALVDYASRLHLSSEECWLITCILRFKYTADTPLRPTQETLANLFGQSLKTIQRTTQKIIARKFLILERVRGDSGQFNHTIYDFTPLRHALNECYYEDHPQERPNKPESNKSTRKVNQESDLFSQGTEMSPGDFDQATLLTGSDIAHQSEMSGGPVVIDVSWPSTLPQDDSDLLTSGHIWGVNKNQKNQEESVEENHHQEDTTSHNALSVETITLPEQTTPDDDGFSKEVIRGTLTEPVEEVIPAVRLSPEEMQDRARVRKERAADSLIPRVRTQDETVQIGQVLAALESLLPVEDAEDDEAEEDEDWAEEAPQASEPVDQPLAATMAALPMVQESQKRNAQAQARKEREAEETTPPPNLPTKGHAAIESDLNQAGARAREQRRARGDWAGDAVYEALIAYTGKEATSTGVTPKVAEQIAREYVDDPQWVLERIEAMAYRPEDKQRPGALVCSIKDNWDLPPAYLEAKARRKTQDAKIKMEAWRKQEIAKAARQREDTEAALWEWYERQTPQVRKDIEEEALSQNKVLRDRKEKTNGGVAWQGMLRGEILKVLRRKYLDGALPG